ncbi:PREDICTED: probable palmitoyltransferase ZDHHC24 [Papilio xuthus]|uniref:Palmitoyltransferase n=2 Tax=Papilio xuthus TaxID=66420 RepID=A0AAJ7E9J2_PAPXU|nr:PREDICTED: probable palmitoyltransferase ZDHHC24 [Papilio xuthus]
MCFKSNSLLLNLNLKNHIRLKRVLEHSIYLAIIFILLPVFIYFELCIVLPAVVEEWSVPFLIHYCCASFLILNIIGNMIFGMFTDTSVRGRMSHFRNKESWGYCSECDFFRPPRAWHCDTCDLCILKRDHHCTFFACCIGHFNYRYFIMFTLDVFVAMLYAFYYNVQFLSQFISWNHGLIIIKFLFPLASFVIDFGPESVYVFLVLINFLVALFTGFLFFYHINNVLNGKITPENKNSLKSVHDKGWKCNLIEVLGTRWHLTWISPFIYSPLPGNGFEWDIDDKTD